MKRYLFAIQRTGNPEPARLLFPNIDLQTGTRRNLLFKTLVLALLFFLLQEPAFSQEPPREYKVVTVVESIVPAGLGRSRIIETQSEADIEAATSERTQGTDSKQNKVKRKDIKVDRLSETKLLNFYSLGGINFQNIASNDAMIQTKMTELSEQGWALTFVTSGVESNAGAQDGDGIFITRMIFSRPRQ